MSPRSSTAQAAATHDAILGEAVDQASLDGLEGVTIGRLATSLGMSKAGVIGQFGSKERLQLETLDAAVAIFRREVWEPAADEPEGIERLRAIAEAWIDHLERDTFPGGCFLTGAAAEFDGRPGEVRSKVAETMAFWHRVLEHEARVAVEAGGLPPGTDPAQVAFEMNSIAMGVNQARQLRNDPAAGALGRKAMERILAS